MLERREGNIGLCPIYFNECMTHWLKEDYLNTKRDLKNFMGWTEIFHFVLQLVTRSPEKRDVLCFFNSAEIYFQTIPIL